MSELEEIRREIKEVEDEIRYCRIVCLPTSKLLERLRVLRKKELKLQIQNEDPKPKRKRRRRKSK